MDGFGTLCSVKIVTPEKDDERRKKRAARRSIKDVPVAAFLALGHAALSHARETPKSITFWRPFTSGTITFHSKGASLIFLKLVLLKPQIASVLCSGLIHSSNMLLLSSCYEKKVCSSLCYQALAAKRGRRSIRVGRSPCELRSFRIRFYKKTPGVGVPLALVQTGRMPDKLDREDS